MKALERSLGLKEKALDGADVAIARTLENLGLVLQGRGDYGRAGAGCDGPADSRGSSSNHPAYVGTLNLIAQQLWFEGQLLESRAASDGPSRSPSAPCAPITRPSHSRSGSSPAHLPTLGDGASLELRACPRNCRAQLRPSHHVRQNICTASGCRTQSGGLFGGPTTFSAGAEHLRSPIRSVARVGRDRHCPGACRCQPWRLCQRAAEQSRAVASILA